MQFKNLLFYNKKGQPINLIYDEETDIYNGSIHFGEVSAELIENETLYILEKIDNGSSVVYSKPHSKGSPLFEYGFENTDTDYKFFTVDNPLNDAPEVEIIDNLEETLLSDPSGEYNQEGIWESSLTDNKPLRTDILISSKEGGEHTNYLIIKNNNKVIVRIELYAFVIEEEERLILALEDFGEELASQEEIIFREKDIRENKKDYKLLNRKRKELLLRLHEIKPFFGSYKAIFGFLDFFDFSNITLKEYWRQLDDGKLITNEIIRGKNTSLYEDINLEKTLYFGLFYKLNYETGEFTDNGIPIMENSFEFSNEEIIIKLFSLKRYFEIRNVTGSTKIIDIVGEKTYYNRYVLRNWIDKSNM
jgi:hypothetical protein